MQLSSVLRLASTCALAALLVACQSSGSTSSIGGGGASSGSGSGTGGGTGGSGSGGGTGGSGGGSTGGTGSGSGSTGGGSTGGGGSGSASGEGLGVFRIGKSGFTTDVDHTPQKGSAVVAAFTERSGDTPGKGTFTSKVSPKGKALGGSDVEFTGMMVAPTDDASNATFSEEFYGRNKTTNDSTGERVKLFYRLGAIEPKHVALINYEGPGDVIGERVSGYAVGGAETAAGNLPKGNAVVYKGRFTGQVASSSNGYNDGDASATVDFTGGKVSGKIWNPDAANPERTPEIGFKGDLKGSRFQATSITATKDGTTTELGGEKGGTLVGGIFGPRGQELGAAVSTPQVGSSGGSDYFWVRGGIVAEKQ